MFLIRVINNTNNISSDTVRAQVNQLPPSISVSKIKARIEISSPLTKHAKSCKYNCGYCYFEYDIHNHTMLAKTAFKKSSSI